MQEQSQSIYAKVDNYLLGVQPNILIPNKNTYGQILQDDIFPQEGNVTFGNQFSGSLKSASFVIGSQQCALIPNQSYFEMDLLMGVTTGAMAMSCDAPISRFRILTQAGTPVVDCEGYNLITGIKQVVSVSNENKACNWHSGLNNLRTADASQDALTQTAIRYCFQPSLEILKQLNSIALPITGSLRFILDFGPDTEVLNQLASTASTEGYKIQNLRYSASLLPYDPNYLYVLRELAQKGGLFYNFTQTWYLAQPVEGTSNTIQINASFKFARAFVAVHRLSAELALADYNNLTKYQCPNGGLVGVEIVQGSRHFPSQRIQSIPKCYMECLKTFKLHNDIDAGNQLTRVLYSTTSNVTGANQGSTGPAFIVAIDLTNGGGTNDGVSTKDGALQYRYNVGTATSGLQADMFVFYDCVLSVINPQLASVDC